MSTDKKKVPRDQIVYDLSLC